MKRVLIIDDECFSEKESIKKGFEGTGVEFFLCDNKDDGIKYVRSRALFDCIVLDWFLDGESSMLSQLILKELEGNYYIPVLIYSAHSENFRADRDGGKVTYPDNLIQEVAKENFADIRTKVEEWLNTNTTAKLSNIYLEEIYDKIHRVFWNLNDIKDGNIAAVYKNIISENGNIDWANDFIINLLLHSVTTDKGFRDKIQPLITQIQTSKFQTTHDEKRKVINKILYYKSTPEFISNGDLIKINDGEQCFYGFITTPDCDLSQKNTCYIEFIKLVRFRSVTLGNSNDTIAEGKSSNHYFLPAVQDGSELIDLVAVYKAKHTIMAKDNRDDKFPKVANRIRYADTFIYENSDCSVTYICSLVNPYKSELMQKKNAHDSRVGIPGVYEYLKKN